MKYKISHHAYFSKEINRKMGATLVSESSWDLLRADDTSVNYAIPREEEIYKKACENVTLQSLSKKIVELTSMLGCSELASIGVGRGMLEDDWNMFKNGAVLFYRVSTELTEQQWNQVFFKACKADIKYLIFILTEVLTIKKAIKEKLIQLRNVLLLKPQTFCGYMYSREYFKQMWNGYYKILSTSQCSGMDIFILERLDEHGKV